LLIQLKKIWFGKVALLGLAVVTLFAAEGWAAAADTIGVIDSQMILTKHPSFEDVAKQLQQIARQKEGEARAAADKETEPAQKNQAMLTKRMELAKEEERLMGPIAKDCQEAVRVVAKKRNVTVVLEKASVYFGGVDITDDVIQQLSLDKAKK
jgi:outer membrane protein